MPVPPAASPAEGNREAGRCSSSRHCHNAMDKGCTRLFGNLAECGLHMHFRPNHLGIPEQMIPAQTGTVEMVAPTQLPIISSSWPRRYQPPLVWPVLDLKKILKPVEIAHLQEAGINLRQILTVGCQHPDANHSFRAHGMDVILPTFQYPDRS